jgi:pyrroloquinoline quinone biosynthesis protein E
MPLIVDFVLHRHNIVRVSAMVELALGLKAERVALSAVRPRGWASKNAGALALAPGEIDQARATVEMLRRERGIAIDFDAAGDAAARDRWLLVRPSGRVLPFEGAEEMSGLGDWNVKQSGLAEIWNALLSAGAEPPAQIEIPHRSEPVASATYSYRRM